MTASACPTPWLDKFPTREAAATALTAMSRRQAKSTRRREFRGQGRIVPFPCLDHFHHGRQGASGAG